MKNEQRTISPCIISAIIACRETLKDDLFEVIIVDSNSLDDSISIAISTLQALAVKHFRVIRVSSSRPTAALGREVGRIQARGEFILFLDGDMFVFRNFVKIGIEFLRRNSYKKIAGIVGGRIDVIPSESKYCVSRFPREINRDHSTTAPGGCLFVRSDCLPNPAYLAEQKNGEEKTLAIRLVGRGYRIMVISENMFIHFNYKAKARSLKEKFFLSSVVLGQSLALLWKYLRHEYSLKATLLLMPKEVTKPLLLLSMCVVGALISLRFSASAWVLCLSAYLFLSKSRFGLPIAFVWNLTTNVKKTKFEIEVIADEDK